MPTWGLVRPWVGGRVTTDNHERVEDWEGSVGKEEKRTRKFQTSSLVEGGGGEDVSQEEDQMKERGTTGKESTS